MAAAVAVPLVVAAIGTATTVWSVEQQKKNAPKLPALPKLPTLADTTPLMQQAAARRQAAAGQSSTLLTGPQGLGTDASQPRRTLLGG